MMNNKWELLSVGLQRAEWLGLPDGLVMDWSDECGLSLRVFYNNPSVDELMQVHAKSRFEIAFRDIDGIGFFGIKFGNMPWSDCCFSPNLYDKTPNFKAEIEDGRSYALNIIVIDTAKGEIAQLRVIALGREFADKFREWCLESLNKNIGRRYYHSVVDKAFKDYPTSESLFEKADFRWVLPHGEDEHTLKVEERD